jgi:Xaa-Pro dipeptidase
MTTGIGGSSPAQELAAIRPWANPAPAIAGAERAQRLDKARQLTAQAGAGALLIGAGASLR